MMSYISKKFSRLRWLIPFLSAAVMAALLCVLLYGPNLGPLYDFLLRIRSAPPVSQELLIIDSSVSGQELGDDILEPSLLSSVLYTMTELGASTLIIQVPILGLSVGGSAGEEEILYRFDDEFSILSSNIRNLFDGIRTGSVTPRDSERYVGELMELSERGKERLVAALVRRDEEDIASMENAAAFFGHARRPGDLLVQLIRTGEGGRPGVLAASGEYSRARPDRDGVLRRIAPVLTAPDLSVEHIVYSALKSRYDTSNIPLDRNGAIVFELPGREIDFRRIGIFDFLAYDEADRNLKRLLLEGEALGIYRNIYGENRPGILYDYALSIREEPASEEARLLWIETRNRYFESLEDFLFGPAEMDLVMAYEEMLDTESRDSVIRIFAALKTSYGELVELRNNLESALSYSFCILGNSRDVEASALLANSIITGRVVKPGKIGYLLLGSLLTAFLVCFFVKSMSPLSTLITGIFLTLLIAAGFCLIFIFYGLWLDPQVPAAAGATGVLVSFTWALAVRSRHNRHFSLAFGPSVSSACLESLIRAGKPLPSQAITARAIVIAIKQFHKFSSEDSKDPVAKSIFLEKASDIFKKAGGTIVGTEEDLVIACFGSPLEQTFPDNRPIVQRARDLVSEITLHPKCGSWNFGLDIGDCVFTWTAVSGYFAIGMPVQKAKILSQLAGRYQARIVISAAVNKALSVDPAVKKLGALKSKDGSIEEPFYQLVVG